MPRAKRILQHFVFVLGHFKICVMLNCLHFHTDLFYFLNGYEVPDSVQGQSSMWELRPVLYPHIGESHMGP